MDAPPKKSVTFAAGDDAPRAEADDAAGDDEEEEVLWGAFCEELKLDRRLARGVAECGWTRPSLVQKASLPVALSGRDVLIRARTGSGKTACYALPVLQRVLAEKVRASDYAGVRALARRPSGGYYSRETRRGDAAAATWIFSWRRGSLGRRADPSEGTTTRARPLETRGLRLVSRRRLRRGRDDVANFVESRRSCCRRENSSRKRARNSSNSRPTRATPCPSWP